MIFLIKCVPPGIYMHTFIKNTYTTSREKLKLKVIEIEDIKLQIRIVNTKLKLREAEFAERAELFRRKVEQLRKARKRVQEIIAADDELRNLINASSLSKNESHCNVNDAPEENNFFVELLKESKSDQVVDQEGEVQNSYRERSGEPAGANRVYSLLHDTENKQDYHVKIVRVTNVYKVAYLRHFIKLKKLRRANRQALLRKKMDTIKELFDDWQRALKMVINSKLSLVNLDSQRLEIPSQEAMGDFLNFNNTLDSDSDCRNSADGYQDEYCVSWTQNQYRPVNDNDFNMNIDVSRKGYDLDECFKYNGREEKCHCNTAAEILFVVPEETSSQIEIEEIKSEK